MLLFVGMSHRTAPLELRERYAVPVEQRPAVRTTLRQLLGPTILLSTCGRLELYADVEPQKAGCAGQAARAWLASRAMPEAANCGDVIETAQGAEALRRLVRVACGLESALEGEDEILGQVRRAWLDTAREGALPPALDAAFRLAVSTGRQARRLGSRDRLSSLADLAGAHVSLALRDRSAPRVLLVGTGPMGRRAAASLRERFGERLDLAMAGRTPARVEAHAAAAGARPLALADLADALAWADATIVALRVSGAIIRAGQVRARPLGRPLLLIDLSLPRAVDPAVGRLPGVELRDVDQIGGEGALARWNSGERDRVDRLVEQAVTSYSALGERPDALATLTALRLQADGIRRAQLARTLRRLPDLDEEARWALDAFSRAIVNRLLHSTTLRLKSDDATELAAQVRQVFGMNT